MLTTNLSEHEALINKKRPYYGVLVGTFKWDVSNKNSDPTRPIGGVIEYYFCPESIFPGYVSAVSYDSSEPIVKYTELTNDEVFEIVADLSGKTAYHKCPFIDDSDNVTYTFEQAAGIYPAYWDKLSQDDIDRLKNTYQISDVQPYLDYDNNKSAMRYSGPDGNKRTPVINNLCLNPENHTITYSTFVTVEDDLDSTYSRYTALDLRNAAFTNSDRPISEILDEITFSGRWARDPKEINWFAHWFKWLEERFSEKNGIYFDVTVDAKKKTAQATVHIGYGITFTAPCDPESNNYALDRIADMNGLPGRNSLYNIATGKRTCPKELEGYLPRNKPDSLINNNGFMDINTALNRQNLLNLEELARDASGLDYDLYLNNIKYESNDGKICYISADITFGGVRLINLGIRTAEERKLHSKRYYEYPDFDDSCTAPIVTFPLDKPSWCISMSPQNEADGTKIKLATSLAEQAIEKPIQEMLAANLSA